MCDCVSHPKRLKVTVINMCVEKLSYKVQTLPCSQVIYKRFSIVFESIEARERKIKLYNI